MFERFTDRARRVIVLAQNEARELGHGYIGTEHILLGLVAEGEGMAAKALQSLDVSLEDLRTTVEMIVGTGESAPSGHIPFTARAKRVLELSLKEALQFGHSYIGTEHLLLGLIREGEGVAFQVLQMNGLELLHVRQTLIQLLSGNVTSPSRNPKQLIVEMSGLGLTSRLTRLSEIRDDLGEDDPSYQLDLARLLETAARRLRKAASTPRPQ